MPTSLLVMPSTNMEKHPLSFLAKFSCQSVERVILPIVAYTRLSSPYNELQGVSIWHAVDLSSMTSFVISSSVTLFAKYPEREAEKKKQGIKNLTDLQAGIEIHDPHHSFIWLCSALPPTLQSSPSL